MNKQSKVIRTQSYVSSFPGYDEYVPVVDEAVDAGWKRQASSPKPFTSKG